MEAALQGELDKVREAPKGDRNTILFKASCSAGDWIPDGHMSYDEAVDMLFQAAEENGYVADSCLYPQWFETWAGIAAPDSFHASRLFHRH